jgi:hypothetical protein
MTSSAKNNSIGPGDGFAGTTGDIEEDEQEPVSQKEVELRAIELERLKADICAHNVNMSFTK